MEAFKFELSFLHWLILGIVSLGVSNVFWYLPYKIAAVTEYYACLRQAAKKADVEGVQMLDDPVLLAKADKALLKETYSDITEEQSWLTENRIVLTGVRKFFAEKLAIWNLLFMFLLFAFIGWMWEVIVFLIQTGEFVNRGTLHGPWVPIYGVGGALIIVVLSSLRKRPLVEFFAIIVLCGFIEYFTSWALQEIYGMRWWDYSGYFLNISGRICLEGLVAFGVLGLMAIYLLAPALDTLLMKIPQKTMVSGTVILMAVFACDVVYSAFNPNTGTGITDMGSRIVTARLNETQYKTIK